MTTCAYPGCENQAEYTCVVCKQRFCADHTYQRGGYVCKTHFNEPAFADPHAPKSSAQWLFDKISKSAGSNESPLKELLSRWFNPK